jgi:hypothetical protein
MDTSWRPGSSSTIYLLPSVLIRSACIQLRVWKKRHNKFLAPSSFLCWVAPESPRPVTPRAQNHGRAGASGTDVHLRTLLVVCGQLGFWGTTTRLLRHHLLPARHRLRLHLLPGDARETGTSWWPHVRGTQHCKPLPATIVVHYFEQRTNPHIMTGGASASGTSDAFGMRPSSGYIRYSYLVFMVLCALSDMPWLYAFDHVVAFHMLYDLAGTLHMPCLHAFNHVLVNYMRIYDVTFLTHYYSYMSSYLCYYFFGLKWLGNCLNI